MSAPLMLGANVLKLTDFDLEPSRQAEVVTAGNIAPPKRAVDSQEHFVDAAAEETYSFPAPDVGPMILCVWLHAAKVVFCTSAWVTSKVMQTQYE